jgi:hypothetical protein
MLLESEPEFHGPFCGQAGYTNFLEKTFVQFVLIRVIVIKTKQPRSGLKRKPSRSISK